VNVEGRTTRIVFAGGGTGGHVYPALAIAEELRRRHPAASIVFVGTRRGLERRLVPASGFRLRTLRLSGLKGAGPLGKLRAAAAAGWAVLRCAAWMVRERPHLAIGVGGYVSGPAVLAARLLKVPTMVQEQNHFPGATNRWLAPRVDAVCVPSEAARERIGGNTIVTGNPVRPAFFEIAERREADAPGLLVFGGTRGASSINRAACAALDSLGRSRPLPHIAHQTGTEDEETVRAAYAAYPGEHEVRAFFDNMPERFTAADVVVCRSGASTIAELCAAGRPAILVPYPHAADDHQRYNAETLRDVGAALLLADDALDGERLAAAVTELLADADRRRGMGRAARALSRPDSAARIADVADELLGRSREGGRRVS
jgi:UDP-N-acetylglucosamine--N-acetylmuramyl-(pentapeptide) pyrophosphoryl-undecaprenol N-acetylglucosamine transferase